MTAKDLDTVDSLTHELELEHRLAFDRTIARISARFVKNADNFNELVQKSLSDIGLLSHADRVYIFSFKEDLSLMDNIFEWCAEGVEAEIDNLKNLPTSLFPWWMAKLTRHEMIVIPKVSALPEAAQSEKDILSAQDIESVLVLPLTVHGQLFGYIGLDNIHSDMDWSSEDFMLLKMASEIFGSAFQRKAYEDALIEKNIILRSTLEESNRLQTQLIQQEKMVGIGQLAAGIAHEINNPLGYAISNYEILYGYAEAIQKVLQKLSQLIKRSKSDTLLGIKDELLTFESMCDKYKIEMITEDMLELLQDSKIGFDRVGKIIASLRNFAHPVGNETFEEENLNDILNEVLIILNNEIKYVAELTTDLQASPHVYCHRGEMGQVFINLIMNAVQAIRMGNYDHMGHIHIMTWERDQSFFLSISDDGIGIPKELSTQIFNPFFTTKSIGEGTGLGLSISYDIIVNKHQGQIHFESPPNGGTTFLIELPIFNETEAQPYGKTGD